MIENKIDGVTFLFFEKLLPFDGLMHTVTTRSGGVSSGAYRSLNLGLGTGDEDENVIKNYGLVSRALGFELSLLAAAKQVHEKKVAFIDEEFKGRNRFELEPLLSGFDALVTSRPAVTLMVRVADCVPIILFDPVQKAVGVAHAGWRGTRAGIGKETVNEMVRRCNTDPKSILAGIGPSIGHCCYPVQEEVAELFCRSTPDAEAFIRKQQGETYLNLWEANRLQLLRQGILPEHIEVAQLCTSCRADLFFSHRREQGKTGRIGAFVGLRG